MVVRDRKLLRRRLRIIRKIVRWNGLNHHLYLWTQERMSYTQNENFWERYVPHSLARRSRRFVLSLSTYSLQYIYSTLLFNPPLSLSVSTLTQRDSSVKCLSFSLATHRPVILYNSLSIQGGFARVYEVVSSDTTQPRLAAKVHF